MENKKIWGCSPPSPGKGIAQGGLALGRGEKTREILARSRAEVFRFFVSGMPLLTPACFFPENAVR